MGGGVWKRTCFARACGRGSVDVEKRRCLVVGNSATMRQKGMGSLRRKAVMTGREGHVK